MAFVAWNIKCMKHMLNSHIFAQNVPSEPANGYFVVSIGIGKRSLATTFKESAHLS